MENEQVEYFYKVVNGNVEYVASVVNTIVFRDSILNEEAAGKTHEQLVEIMTERYNAWLVFRSTPTSDPEVE